MTSTTTMRILMTGGLTFPALITISAAQVVTVLLNGARRELVQAR